MGPAVLIADDYGLADGVSLGIEELIAARRLSGTSAIVTLPGWPDLGQRVARLRAAAAVGLHLNLTLGQPLRPMPVLAPKGTFRAIEDISRAALARRLDVEEIAAEAGRQLDRFAEIAGAPPDFVDGHQHVHALPMVREGLFRALEARPPLKEIVLRDPADIASRIVGRGRAVAKALLISVLSFGFGAEARRRKFSVNSGFSGVSDFSVDGDVADEFKSFLALRGPRHLVMCHPGHVDAELGRLDPVTERREREFALLLKMDALDEAIWHPRRRADGSLDWPWEAR